VRAGQVTRTTDTDRTVGILLCLSVVANLCLAMHLAHPRHGSGRHFLSRQSDAQSPSERPKREHPINHELAARSAPADQLAPPFLWAEVESADYRQYIANLRTVGCPEETIRDIIATDLSQLFAARGASIWKPPAPTAYWQKPKNEQPDSRKLRELNALTREQTAILQELLGTRVTQQELIDTVYLQFFGPEQELAFLPDEKRHVAVQAVAGVDEDLQEAMAARDYSASQRDLFQRKLALLANVLSPAELDEFKLRLAPAAENLRMESRYFDFTPDEFKMLLEARMRDNKDEVFGADLLNRSAAADQVRKLFGEERAKEFERKSEMFYINARWAAEDQGLSDDTGEAAWRITRDTRDTAARLATVTPLSSAEGKAQLDELLKQARVQLEATLGPAAARSFVRDLRNVITAPPAPARRSP